jgi:hypothetical protein
MRTIKSKSKCITYLLSMILLLQSCTIYHSSTGSAEQAIASNNKVRVDGSEGFSLKFKKIERIDDEIYGLTKTKSSTYKRLKGRETKESQLDDHIYVRLSEKEIQSLHLKNRTASTVVTILVPVLAIGVLVFAGTKAVEDIGPFYGE